MGYLKKSKFVFLFFCVLTLALCLPRMVYAHTQPELDRQGNVTISYEVSGAKFYLYKVADMSEKVKFSLSGDFAGYPVSLENLDSDGWRSAAQTLEAYAARDSRTALAEGTTDTEGKLQFTNLTTGLYLVTGDILQKENVIYEPSPALVSLPDLNTDDTWNYALVISPKYAKYEKQENQGDPDKTVQQGIQEPETVTCKVTKLWEDEENKASRPASITAQLLKDGEVYAEKKLNKENQWTYTWTELEKGHKWTVIEKTTDKSYTVKVQKSGTDFVITNTYKKEPASTPSPAPGNPGGAQDGGTNGKGGGTNGKSGGAEVKLPQTGQLWWPVPYLALGGMLLLCLGVFQWKRES